MLRALLISTLTIAVVINYFAFANADIIVPPQAYCGFSQQFYSPGDTVVIYVHVQTVLYQPILVGNMPTGQVTINLGTKLDAGDYSFPVGTAVQPNGFREVDLYAQGGLGGNSYVHVAKCSYGVVPEFGGTATIVLLLVMVSILLLLARRKRKVKN